MGKAYPDECDSRVGRAVAKPTKLTRIQSGTISEKKSPTSKDEGLFLRLKKIQQISVIARNKNSVIANRQRKCLHWLPTIKLRSKRKL